MKRDLRDIMDESKGPNVSSYVSPEENLEKMQIQYLRM